MRENSCYDILGKFDSTLELYCHICQEIDAVIPLLTSYMHLNDTINVKKHYEQYKESGSNIAYIYKNFHKYIDSEKILDSKYISIKFDKRVEEFAKAVFEHVHSIETFITQE